jgi:replicative DNA helicase
MDVVPKKANTWLPDRLPEDVDAERSFIATVCAPGGGRICVDAILESDAEDFVHPVYKSLMIAAKSLVHRDIPIDSLSLKAELETMGVLHVVGGYTGLVEALMGEDVERPGVLLDVISRKSRLRKLIHAGSKMVRMASEHGDYASIVSEASEAITRLALDHPGKQIITDLSDLLDDLANGKQITTENGGKAMSWGDDTLDLICPIPRGEPTIVCARPGCGKSALAIQILTATVERGLGKPLFLSLEMGREKVKARMAAHLSEVNSRAFRDGHYDSHAIERIIHRKGVLSGMKVMFPMQQCRVEEIEYLVKHAVEVHGVTCVVMDQFSHVAAPREAGKDNYAIANAQTSKHLTSLAKNLNLGWVTLAQINKDGEDSRRPTGKDLAGTDRLYQDAAVAFGMWNKGSDENQEVWGTIMKNRDDGFKGWAKQLSTDYGTCRFKVMEHETSAFLPEKRRGRA